MMKFTRPRVLLEVLGIAYGVAYVFVGGVEVVVGLVPVRGGAVGEGAQDVRRHLADDTGGGAGDAVRLVAVDGLDPAHRAAVVDAGSAGVRVVGGIPVAGGAQAGQRRVREHLDGARHRVGGVHPVVFDADEVREAGALGDARPGVDPARRAGDDERRVRRVALVDGADQRGLRVGVRRLAPVAGDLGRVRAV